MLRFVKQIVWLLGVVVGCQSAFGFALIGPTPATTSSDGFQGGTAGQQIGYDIGGGEDGTPKNIHEGYRRNMPVVYYACDESFWQYFGTNGVFEIDKAFAMYNSVGKVSALNPDDYPEDSRRVNFRAQADGLIDLKSFIMGLMTHQVGLFEPTRWVWALSGRVQLAGTPSCPFNMEYTIYNRNFSITPVGQDNYPTTTYVNGVLYTYFIDEACRTVLPLADAVEVPVDPLSSPYSAVADFTSFWYEGLPIGGFYTSLTRDDVAGLKFIYATNNLGYEASGARTTEFITNTAPAAIQTFDLNLFATQARVSSAAALTALYPGLIITSTSNTFGLQITTNITELLVNAPTDPAGLAPSHPLFSTNYTTNFVQFFEHTFANIVTNSYATRGIIGTLTLGLSNAPFAPAGAVPAVVTNSTLTVRPIPVSGVFGDFFILPTNQCGALILSNLLTTVVPTITVPVQVAIGVTNTSITFIPGSITFATNHVVVYLPVTCPVDSVAKRGGTDRLIFIRRDFDATTGRTWEPVTNDYTLPELDETTSTISLRHFQRRVPRPDILFSTADFSSQLTTISYTNTVDGASQSFTFTVTGVGSGLGINTINFDEQGHSGNTAGPGTIVDPTILSTLYVLNRVSPTFVNFSAFAGSTNSFLFPTEAQQSVFSTWGSFDGTTNAPVVYPNGSTLEDLENIILGPSSNTSFIPNGNIGVPYIAQLSAIGGHPPYTWDLAPTSPGLPAGLNISSNGRITGTPTGPAAVYDITVRITDSANVFRDVQYTITIF